MYPVTNESVTLSALLEDGRLIEGESHIGVHHDGPKNGIVKLMVNPEKPKAVDGVIKALEKADIIVLGPETLTRVLYLICLWTVLLTQSKRVMP